MSDPFFDDYYDQTKERLELAKQAYKLAHNDIGDVIERRVLSKFDLNDPRRSKATVRSVSGIRDQFKNFEDRLLEADTIVAFAAIQRDQFVFLTGIIRANDELRTQRGAGIFADDPLDRFRQAMSTLRRMRAGLEAASAEMDVARREANLQVGALRDAIATVLLGRFELILAFGDTEVPVTLLQALKALRDVSARQAAEQIGEALVEAVKAVAPQIAAELVRVGSIVRIYQEVAKAFAAHGVDTNPNAVEAVQRLCEAMEEERDALAAIKALADRVAQEIAVPRGDRPERGGG